jgi:hypothetical protein
VTARLVAIEDAFVSLDADVAQRNFDKPARNAAVSHARPGVVADVHGQLLVVSDRGIRPGGGGKR